LNIWATQTRTRLRRLIGRPVFPDHHYFAARGGRVACCAIPKNACTALKYWMLWLDSGPAHGLAHGEVHPLAVARLGLSRSRLDEMLSQGTCFLFTFVRNPWHRLASAYLDKFVRAPSISAITRVTVESVQLQGQRTRHRRVMAKDPETAQPLSVDPRVDYERGITFEEFVRHVERSPDHALDDHWRPQWQFLAGRRFDSVGRFESFNTDLAAIADRIGAPIPLPEPPPAFPKLPPELDLRREPSGALRRLGAMPTAESLLRGDLVDRIAHRYARDAEQFGYGHGPEPAPAAPE
jgi:hypothetical protein